MLPVLIISMLTVKPWGCLIIAKLPKPQGNTVGTPIIGDSVEATRVNYLISIRWFR